jgi:hypothetical protein
VRIDMLTGRLFAVEVVDTPLRPMEEVGSYRVLLVGVGIDSMSAFGIMG